jgi:enoyl-CoA hydratase/carnithine racemase
MSLWAEAPGDVPILHAVRDGVGVLTLNRPERLNAWTPAMGSLYFDRLYQAARDRRAYWFPLSIGKPIVAAIHGACFGVGLQQALCCDIRFVAEDAKIAAPYAKRGLIGEVGITGLLPRIVGAADALDMLLSGRTLSAQEAYAMRLANRVVPTGSLFQTAFDYCAALADGCAPGSMRTMKQQVYRDLMSALADAFDRSETLLAEALAGRDFAEGVQAFTDKRPPRFPPLDPDLWAIDPTASEA